VTGYTDLYAPTGSTVTIPAAEGGLAGTYSTAATYKVDGSPATLGVPAVGGVGADPYSDPDGRESCSDDGCRSGADYVDLNGNYHYVKGHKVAAGPGAWWWS
jgi:hypothetical protein